MQGERVHEDLTDQNEEERRLDREWYGMDEGQDEYHNAFRFRMIYYYMNMYTFFIFFLVLAL